MALRQEFSRTQEYLIIRSAGTIETMDDLKAYLHQFIAYCARENCPRILGDERQMHYGFGALEHFEIAEWLETEPFKNRIERAATLTTQDQVLNLKDFEVFAINRGLNFKIFASGQLANDWLTAVDKPVVRAPGRVFGDTRPNVGTNDRPRK